MVKKSGLSRGVFENPIEGTEAISQQVGQPGRYRGLASATLHLMRSEK